MPKFLLLIALLLPASAVFADDAPAEVNDAGGVAGVDNVAAEAVEPKGVAEEAAQTQADPEGGVTIGDFNIWLTLMWVGVLGIPLVVTLLFIATVKHKPTHTAS